MSETQEVDAKCLLMVAVQELSGTLFASSATRAELMMNALLDLLKVGSLLLRCGVVESL